MQGNTPLVMIGLDAAEVTLVERLCSEGQLPALQALRQRGCYGALEAPATIFSGGVWPTFYTAKGVPWHGIYHNSLWHHEKMRFEIVNDQWLPENPFWQILDQDKYRVAVIDVPMVAGAPKSVHGIQLAGWGTHDLISRGSWPPGLWQQLVAEFGPPIMSRAPYGPQTAQTLLQLRELLLTQTEQMGRVSEALLVREPWDLFLVVFGATHPGGHYLWDLSQIDKAGLASEKVLDHALVDIYQACDQAVARLLERVPKNAKILIFAVHGMGPNPGWSDRGGEILSRIQQAKQEASTKRGVLNRLNRLKQALPRQWKRNVAKHLSQGVLNGWANFWSSNAFDWSRTRYFPLPMDHAGYLRINLKGREPQGIVEPGQEYAALCQELQEAFLSFRDLETGEAIVKKVYHQDELAPPSAPYRAVLPDLVMTWGSVSAIQSRGISSKQYGEIHWNNHGKLPSGRSGNHSEQGWFVAVGEGIPPATQVKGHHIVDLVPTVFHWLGASQSEDFQGQPIAALCLP